MKHLLLLSIFGLASHFGSAQQYRTAVGLKGDYSTLGLASADFTVKHFFLGQNAFEVNFGASTRHFWVQAFYQKNNHLTNDLEWYWGTGPDFGYWWKGVNIGGRVDHYDGFWAGMNGIIGLEYTFEYIPINLALDTGPTVRIVPDVQFGWIAGFSLRYGFR